MVEVCDTKELQEEDDPLSGSRGNLGVDLVLRCSFRLLGLVRWHPALINEHRQGDNYLT